MHDDEVLKISNGNELPVLIRWIPIYVDSVVDTKNYLCSLKCKYLIICCIDNISVHKLMFP